LDISREAPAKDRQMQLRIKPHAAARAIPIAPQLCKKAQKLSDRHKNKRRPIGRIRKSGCISGNL
jgi:hypothetical protein